MTLNQKYQSLISRIKGIRKKQNQIDLLSSFFRFFFFIALLIVGIATVEYLMKGDEGFRKLIFNGGLILGSFLLILNFYKPIGKLFIDSWNISFEKLAIKIGNHFDDLKDRLLNSIQIFGENSESNLSAEALDETYKISHNKNFNLLLERRKLYTSLILFLVSGIGFFGFYSVENGLSNAITRVIDYDKSYLPPIPFSLSIVKQDSLVERGADISINIIGLGQLPETIELGLKEANQNDYEKYTLRKDSSDNYFFSIKSLKSSISFYAQGDFLNQFTYTDTAKIDVFDLPYVKKLDGKVNYPNYSKISPQILDNNSGDITALKGSVARFNLKSNSELDSAKLIFEKAKSLDDTLAVKPKVISLNVSDDSAQGNLRINETGEYFFKLYSNNLENKNPIRFKVLSLEDDSPRIRLLQPDGDVQLNSKAILPILAEISDDYGLSDLYLNYKLIFSKYVEPDVNYQKIKIDFINDAKSLEVPYVWDLNEIGISPEDKFEFFLEVFDNDIINGPKSAKTPIFKLRLPSLDEAFEEAELAQKEIEDELKDVLKESAELKEKIEYLENELRKDSRKKKMDFKEKKEAEEIFEKRNQLKEKVDEISKKLEQTSKQMQDNQMLSKETLEKYQKLQELMKEVSIPDFMKRSEKINEQLEKMSPEEMRKALEQTKMDEEQFQQQIERSMQMLKKLQAEQKMDEIAKKAKEFEQEQKEIQEQLSRDNLSNKEQQEFQRKQEALKDKLGDIEQEMKNLSEFIKETGNEEAAKDFEKAVDKLNPEQTQKNLDEASKNMQDAFNQMQQEQNNQQQNQQNPNQQSQENEQMQQYLNQAQQKQQQIQENMKDFAQQMQAMKQKMMQQAMQKMVKDMKKSISDLLELSKQQEALKNQTEELNYSSNQLPRIQNQQGDISNSLNSVGRKLMELSEQSFEITPEMGQEIANAMQKMAESAKELSERRPNQSSQRQQQSMQSLNKAASQMQGGLQQMMQQMQQQQSAGQQQPGGSGQGQGQGQGQMPMPMPSFGQQLQNAAAQQQLLKQSMQQMMKGQGQQGQKPGQGQQGQDPRDTRTGQEGRLKDQIGNARKSLDELAEEQKRNGKGGEKLQNELRKISEEMKELMADIERGNIDQNTLKKQERILSRLLDASKSENERDYQKKREAKVGKDYKIESPDEIDWQSRQRKREIELLMKELEESYSKDYELIIKEYFESLKELEEESN